MHPISWYRSLSLPTFNHSLRTSKRVLTTRRPKIVTSCKGFASRSPRRSVFFRCTSQDLGPIMCFHRVFRYNSRYFTSNLVTRAGSRSAFNYHVFPSSKRWRSNFFQCTQSQQRSSLVRAFRLIRYCLIVTRCFGINRSLFFCRVRRIVNREIVVIRGRGHSFLSIGNVCLIIRYFRVI